MNANYSYIIDRLGEPLYYDTYGAPHYEIGNWALYSKEALIEFLSGIKWCECQACGSRFRVENHHPVYSTMEITDNYGDPPVHGCVGDTMSTDDLEAQTIEEWVEMLKKAQHLKSEDKEYVKKIDKLIKKMK